MQKDHRVVPISRSQSNERLTHAKAPNFPGSPAPLLKAAPTPRQAAAEASDTMRVWPASRATKDSSLVT